MRVRIVSSTSSSHADHASTLIDANGKKDECLIGKLSEDGVNAMREDAVRAAKELAKVKEERKGMALQPDVFTQAKLVKRQEVSSDTRCSRSSSALLLSIPERIVG